MRNKDAIYKELEEAMESVLAKIKDLEAEIAQRDKAIASKPLQFMEGETAWYVDNWGVTAHTTYCNGLHKIADNNRLFKSEQMAEEFRQKSQFIADALYWKELFDREYVPDWGNAKELKWHVTFDTVAGMFTTGTNTLFDANQVYFSERAIAKEFADWLNER